MNAVEFLRSKRLLSDTATEFVIRKPEGTVLVELAQLLDEYAQQFCPHVENVYLGNDIWRCKKCGKEQKLNP